MVVRLLRRARELAFELSAAALAAAFLLSGRVTPATALRSVDYDLLMVLFALLIAVEILRQSGWLDHAVDAAVRRFGTTRSFAAMMLVVTGVLAAVITNDVALFVVIPFTVAASRMSNFDVEDAVVLEVIAANLIGCLTPLGNPQNLFVFHRSAWSAATFVAVMAPLVVWCAVGLTVAVFLLGRPQALQPADVVLPRLRGGAAAAGAITFALVLLEIARVLPAWPAAAAALITGVIVLRRGILDVDLSIVPLFFFAFIIVEGLRTFPLGTFTGADTYVSAIALSQFISNVPAAILLSPFAHADWRALLYGVSAGGCGTIIASLANLLGWRIYVRESNRDPRFFWRLTAINFGFLAWAGLGGWVLLKT